MTKIIRKTGDVKAFGSSATGTNRTVFGADTQSDTLDDNVTAELLTGWQIVGANEKPTLQDFNAAGFTAGQYIAYLHQMGIPEWDGAQQYQINSFANRVGVIYRCKTADHTSATVPESDGTNWVSILAEITASDVINTPAGSIAATTVQAALNELDTEKAALAGANFTGPAKSTAGAFNLVTNTALSDAAATLTASQLIGGEFTITPTAARIQTLDTAANIISALSGSVNNSNFQFTIVNLAAFNVTVATAAGVNLVGNMNFSDGAATFRIRRTSGSTVSVTRLDVSKKMSIAIIADVKPARTAGGTFTSGSFRTRDLQTVISDVDNIVSISSNQFTLQSGTYTINWSAPGRRVGLHKSILYDITSGSDVLVGTPEDSINDEGGNTKSQGSAVLLLTSASVFEIRHRCEITHVVSGFGGFADFDEDEIYTTVEITKN